MSVGVTFQKMPSADTVMAPGGGGGGGFTWRPGGASAPRERRGVEDCHMDAAPALFVLAAVGTFSLGCVGVRTALNYWRESHWLVNELYLSLHFMDLYVVLSFALGLACTLFVMYALGIIGGELPALSKDEWRTFVLQERVPISKSTSVYRFAIKGKLGLPIGQHVSVRAPVDGKMVMRSYTPISPADTHGHVDLLVKSYPTGNLSRVIGELKVGDKVEMKGPKGRFLYSANMVSHFGMIAGGTGITPCYQVIQASLSNPDDRTQIDLIYANVNEDEILLRDELDALAKAHPDRFRVHYFLNVPPANWQGGVGFVTQQAIAQYMPPPASDGRLLMCGPPPMMDAMKRHLAALKYPAVNTLSKADDRVFVF